MIIEEKECSVCGRMHSDCSLDEDGSLWCSECIAEWEFKNQNNWDEVWGGVNE